MYTKLTVAVVALLACTQAVKLEDAHAAAGDDCGCDGCCGGNDVKIDIAFNVNVAKAAGAAADEDADLDGSES